MAIKGVLLDSNGTMIDIHTNEWHEDLYRVVSNLLSYQGIAMSPDQVKKSYFKIMEAQQKGSAERYPEFDVVALFRTMITANATPFSRALDSGRMAQLPLFLGQVHRAAARYRLQLFPGVADTIQRLAMDYRMGVVTNAQSAYAGPELQAVGLLSLFDPVIVSGDFGYAKPDPRLFATALERMGLAAAEVVFVGNDQYHDIQGAKHAGMKTVFFQTSQGGPDKPGSVEPDYIIYRFPELLEALKAFQAK
jgi:putative hydrolase of the HAD superfamily